MVRPFLDKFAAILDQVRTWGFRLPRAKDERGPVVVQVYGPGGAAERRRIGTLWQERGQFMFRYDASFAASPSAEPISTFPDLAETYSSAELWPFFAVRIPPLQRSDVKRVLARHGLKPEQILEVLGTIAKTSISNPYELELARDGRPPQSGPRLVDDAGTSLRAAS